MAGEDMFHKMSRDASVTVIYFAPLIKMKIRNGGRSVLYLLILHLFFAF